MPCRSPNRARRDAALIRLDAPATVHQGDTISLLATVRSTTAAQATLSIALDGGEPASQVVRLRRGENPFTLSYTAVGGGWHSFRARVALPGDERVQNDALTASVRIGAPPRVIVASAGPAPPIASILAARGVRATVAAPASLPRAAADYAAVDAVVLDDVPANLLGASQVGALAGAVQDGGLGLLTLGGRHAYSLGGYAHSALDRLLPVASLSPGDLQRRRLAVELVLDRSGSMADTAGGEGIPKMAMAKSAARQTAEFVSSRGDELGIVGFDSAPQRVLAMQRVTPGASLKRVLAGIGGVTADGGTDIYRGLEAGLNELLASKAPNRHMILLTDGISQEHDYTALLERLKRNRIAVATVALGTDVDAALLRRISKATGGNAYATKLAADLPRIFVKETRLSTEPIQIVGAQEVLPAAPARRALTRGRRPAAALGQRRDPPAPRSPGRPDRAQRLQGGTGAGAVGLRHRPRRLVDARPRRSLGDPLDGADGALERRRALGRPGRAARAGRGHGRRGDGAGARGRPRSGRAGVRDEPDRRARSVPARPTCASCSRRTLRACTRPSSRRCPSAATR